MQPSRPKPRLLAGLPLPARRRLYRGLFVASAAFRRPWTSGLKLHFERVLRLPRRRADALDREAAFFDWLAELEWAALRWRTKAGIRSDLDRVTVSDPALLQQLADSGRPIALAPLHMGAYTGCLAAILFRFFPGRSFLILRRRDDMPFETSVMERLREFGVPIRFLNVTDKADYLAAMRFARKGAVLVVFCDLPPSYGMPAAMPMFGLDLNFAFGLDSIARLTDAVVLPISTVARLDGDDISLGQPFEVRDARPDTRARAAERIRRHIREAIDAHPEQWHLWPTFADYLPAPASMPEPAEAASTLAEAAE